MLQIGSVKAHGTENFFSSGSYYNISSTMEDELFLKWAKGFNITGAIYANYSRYLQKQVKYNPIPGSFRDMNKHLYDVKGNKRSKYNVVNKINDIIIQYF